MTRLIATIALVALFSVAHVTHAQNIDEILANLGDIDLGNFDLGDLNLENLDLENLDLDNLDLGALVGAAGNGTVVPTGTSPKPSGSSPPQDDTTADYDDSDDYDMNMSPGMDFGSAFLDIPPECSAFFNSTEFITQADQCGAEKESNPTICPQVCIDFAKSVPQVCIEWSKKISEQFGIDYEGLALEVSDPNDPCLGEYESPITTASPTISPSPTTTVSPVPPTTTVVSPTTSSPADIASAPPVPSSASCASVVLAAAVAVVGLVMA